MDSILIRSFKESTPRVFLFVLHGVFFLHKIANCRSWNYFSNSLSPPLRERELRLIS